MVSAEAFEMAHPAVQSLFSLYAFSLYSKQINTHKTRTPAATHKTCLVLMKKH